MSYPASSAIPGALAQFMIIAAAAFPAGTTIWFGEELATYATPLTLQITEIVGDQKPASIGQLYTREENFSLICTLSFYQGGPPAFTSLLPTLMTDFALLTAAVGNNPSLNGAVRYAQVGNFAIKAVSDSNGLGAVTIDFQVRCEQRVLSLNSS
jgi:hypothetical protein